MAPNLEQEFLLLLGISYYEKNRVRVYPLFEYGMSKKKSITGRPLGYSIFSLMALIGDHIYLHFSIGFRGQPGIVLLGSTIKNNATQVPIPLGEGGLAFLDTSEAALLRGLRTSQVTPA